MRCIGAKPRKQNMVNLWFYKIGETNTFIVLEMKLTVFQIQPNKNKNKKEKRKTNKNE